MTFGDLEAGAGPDERYLGHVNLFRYTPKSTFNFIGNMNNIGRQVFTPRDYFRFMGGMQSMVLSPITDLARFQNCLLLVSGLDSM